ncbi:MAG: hypothetical protein HQL12_09220 [Candidatus Omnitrophica bacterium]|nr:hypothetical protein [Candidatus Omnitrophota bacterium]
MLNISKILIILLILSLTIIKPNFSYAWEHSHHGNWQGSRFHRSNGVHSGFVLGLNYTPLPYYYDPWYYCPNYYDSGVLVSQPVAQTSKLVDQPSTTVVTAAPAYQNDDTFIINIPNSTGDYSSVLIKRSGNGFMGPQGEYYPEFPKVSQLKVMYGNFSHEKTLEKNNG